MFDMILISSLILIPSIQFPNALFENVECNQDDTNVYSLIFWGVQLLIGEDETFSV